MAESRFSAPRTPADALEVARDHYAHGMHWLERQEVADTPESRIRCATAATARFAAGQLALAFAVSDRSKDDTHG